MPCETTLGPSGHIAGAAPERLTVKGYRMSKEDQGPDGRSGSGHVPEVLRLSRLAPPGGAHIAHDLRSYWQGLRRGRAVPERADIDPRAIERSLEFAFILERIAAGHARFRIAGMHLNDLMGMELRGMPLSSFFMPEARAQVSNVLEQVFQGPEIADLTLVSAAGFGREELSARMLLLPLRSDLGDVSRVLGCLVAGGATGRAPRRFTIQKATVEAVIAGAPTGPRETPPEPALLSGFAEPPAPAPQPPLAPTLQNGTQNDSPEARRARFRVVK